MRVNSHADHRAGRVRLQFDKSFLNARSARPQTPNLRAVAHRLRLPDQPCSRDSLPRLGRKATIVRSEDAVRCEAWHLYTPADSPRHAPSCCPDPCFGCRARISSTCSRVSAGVSAACTCLSARSRPHVQERDTTGTTRNQAGPGEIARDCAAGPPQAAAASVRRSTTRRSCRGSSCGMVAEPLSACAAVSCRLEGAGSGSWQRCMAVVAATFDAAERTFALIGAG